MFRSKDKDFSGLSVTTCSWNSIRSTLQQTAKIFWIVIRIKHFKIAYFPPSYLFCLLLIFYSILNAVISSLCLGFKLFSIMNDILFFNNNSLWRNILLFNLVFVILLFVLSGEKRKCKLHWGEIISILTWTKNWQKLWKFPSIIEIEFWDYGSDDQNFYMNTKA